MHLMDKLSIAGIEQTPSLSGGGQLRAISYQQTAISEFLVLGFLFLVTTYFFNISAKEDNSLIEYLKFCFATESKQNTELIKRHTPCLFYIYQVPQS